MNAASLLDVNVLFALLWPAHGFNPAAQRWFRDHARKGWATCPFTQSAFVRLSSNPSRATDSIAPASAIELLEMNLHHPYHEFWGDQLTLPDAVAPFRERITGQQQITDAYLLGLAMRKKARLITFDKSIASLLPPGARKSDHIVEL